MLPALANADGQKLGLAFVNGIMGYAQTEHPDQAMRFIEYWSGVGDQLMLGGASGVSPRKSLDSNPAFDTAPLYRDAVAAWGAPVAQPLYAQSPSGFAAMNTLDGDISMMTDLERALFSGQDVMKAAEDAQAKVQRVIDDSK